jgi:hypothetical protein
MGHQTFGTFTIDVATDLSVELEQGLNAYMASLHDEEPAPTLSGEPFCGCETCHTREILAFVVPRVLFAQEQGLASLVSVDVPPKCGVTILASGSRCALPMNHMGDHS